MTVTLQSSSGEIKIMLQGNEEERLQEQIDRFLQRMARTGQRGYAARNGSANGHRPRTAEPRSAPAEIIGRIGYPLYRD